MQLGGVDNTNLDQNVDPMLHYMKETNYPRKQELTDFRRKERFIGSLACIQPMQPLPVLRQAPEDGLAPCHEKDVGEALLAFLSRSGMLVGRAAMKMGTLFSDGYEEQSRVVVTMVMDMETRPPAAANQPWGPRREDQTVP